MHRMPLTDELPYRFLPPRLNPLIVRATRGLRSRMLRVDHRVEQVDVQGVEHLKPLLDRADGILLTPNHCDRADGLIMLDLADRLNRPSCAMAAHQIFEGNAGLRRWLFPRLGIFPVDRDGADVSAVKAAVDLLVAGRYPLVVFPEGEIYHTADRLTPLREGVAFLAATAARKAAQASPPQTVWIVPIGIKYRFLDGHDPMPALLALMDQLEARFTWRNRGGMGLMQRIYDYAAAVLTLKEMDYHGEPHAGVLTDRIAALRTHILDDLDRRHFGAIRTGDVPTRVKDLRRHCIEVMAQPGASAESTRALRRDLDDVFFALQLFSYPGDYVRQGPTVERVSEVLMKFEEDLLGAEIGTPQGPRRAVMRIGEPIDVGARLKGGTKLRATVGGLTTDLEGRIQALLDTIGPGRPLAC